MSEVDNELTTPLVSICTLVYNHEPYLRECFDGFLMQKTNFAFEVLVHDDASTDGSADIIREYSEKYPHIFKPIYQKENQYSKGVKVSATFQFPRAKGKYIALCEGDDYWTDPLKLQKQVDFLESHPEYVMCSHRFNIFNQDVNLMRDDYYGDLAVDVIYDISSLINSDWYFQPLTVMFRLEHLCLDEYIKYRYSKDCTLFYHLLKKGKGYMIAEKMGVYRHHSGGVWVGASDSVKVADQIKNRIGILEIEQSYEAAYYLRSLFRSWIPRSFMLREWILMMKAFGMISKHFGVMNTLRLFIMRFLSTKELEI